MKDDIESMLMVLFRSMAKKNVSTDAGNIIIAMAIFYVGTAIYKLAIAIINNNRFGIKGD